MSELRFIKFKLDFPLLSCLQELLKVLKVAFKRLILRFSFTAWRTDIAIINKDGEELLAVFITDPPEYGVDKRLEDPWTLLRSKIQAPWEHDPSPSHQS